MEYLKSNTHSRREFLRLSAIGVAGMIDLYLFVPVEVGHSSGTVCTLGNIANELNQELN